MSKNLEAISVRSTRLNNLILGRSEATSKIAKPIANGLCRESLLDALCLLYDECNKDYLKKKDKNVFEFVKKYRDVINETNNLRVNISDFSVKNLIGKGYFGDVHLATEKTTNDVYAVKKIFKNNAITTAQLKEERDIMATATSEWITSLQYAFQDSDCLYLVMEYLPGGDLLSLMHRTGAFDEDLAKFYIAEMTLAIHALHTMGYVHRDIKPENICLDRFGHLKLADFGSAVQLNKDGNAITFSPVGTPDYIAPELLQTLSNKKLTKSIHGVSTVGSSCNKYSNQDNIQEDEQFQISCDYWSMGIIAYELITEVTPFHNDNVNETYTNIMNIGDFRMSDKITYPEGLEVSKHFANLIDGLVTSASKRLTYKQIIKHPYFDGIDWIKLRQQPPPIIPTISSEEDVSNFEGIEKKGRPNTYSKSKPSTSCKGNEFSGQNLPYLGYSYVNEQNCSMDLPTRSLATEKLILQIKELERTIEEHVNHIKTLQRDVLDAQRKSAQTTSLEKILLEAKHELTNMKEQLKEKSVELASYKTEVKTLQGALKIEEENRLKNDKEITTLLNSTYQKWEKAKFASEKNYEKQLSACKTEIISLTKNLTVRESELSSKVDECKHLQERVEKYQELLKTSKEQNITDKADFDKKQAQLIDGYELKVQELRNKLKLEKDAKQLASDELRDARRDLDDSICSAKSISQSKQVSERNNDEIISRMNQQIEENKMLRQDKANIERKMEDMQKRCDEYTNELERLREEQMNLLANRVSDAGSELFCSVRGSLESLNNVEELTKQLAASQENEDLQRQRAERLEQIVARLESAVNSFEPKSSENLLERQNEKLEGQLNSVREQAILERQASRTAFLSLYKLEKQIEDLNAEKKVQNSKLELADKNLKKIRDDKDEIQRDLRDAKATIRSKEDRISELQSEIRNLKDDLKKEHSMWEKAEHERMKEKSEIIEHVSNVHKLEEKLEEEKRKLNTTLQRNTSLDFDNKCLVKERARLNDELIQANESVKELETELKSARTNFEMLKHTCTIMDAQLNDLQGMYETEVQKNKSLCEKSDNLWSQVKGHHDEFQKLRTKLNELESLKDACDFKCNQLLKELEQVKTISNGQHQKMIQQQEELISKTEMLFEVQEKLEVMAAEKSNLQGVAENMSSELQILKEENSKILTDLFLTKEETNNLCIERKEIKNEMNLMKQELEQLNGTLLEQKNYYTQRVIKAEAIQAQFQKLSEYLQKKVEELSCKKKKSLAEVLFGTHANSKKENVPPIVVEDSVAFKSLREELKRERARCNQLKEQLLQAKTDIRAKDHVHTTDVAPVHDDLSEITAIKDQESPQMESKSSKRESIKRRSYQTHRFEMSLESSAADCQFSMCLVCEKPILIGQPYWRCKECNSSVHRKCRSEVKTSCDGEEMTTVFSRLTAERDASNDVPSESGVSEASDYGGELILKTKNLQTPIKINCVYQTTTSVFLFGCETGLYSYNQMSCQLTHITGIDCVDYMAINENLSKCILIGSHGETLNQCDSRHLFNRAQASSNLKPKLETTPLEITFANRIATERWHYAKLHSCDDKISESLLIACTSARIVIMRFDITSDRFKPVCALDTATPVESILFTQHSAIVCSDKFFEIDLSSLTPEEFLNESDPSLVTTKNCKPMAAYKINKQEFLLCFEEFGMFVDEYGSRSRPNDINWANRPNGFWFREPFLFVTYINMIQVIRINKSFSGESETRRKIDEGIMVAEMRAFLNFNAPKIAGNCGQLGVFVLVKPELNDNGQHLIYVDGVMALKSNMSNSLETLLSSMTSIPRNLAGSVETFNSSD